MNRPHAGNPPPEHQARSLVPDDPEPRPKAPWVTVSGGKGGVGKTLLASNLAVSVAKAGYRTLLVDLDPGLANIDVHLRLAPVHTLEDLAEGRCKPSEAVTPGPAQLGVLCGRSGSTLLADGDPQALKRVFAAIEQVAEDYDLVICDTGAGIGRSVLGAASRSDLFLAVTSGDPAAITDTYALCKLLLKRHLGTPQLLINRVRSRDEAMRTAGRLSTVSERFLGQALKVCGWLRDDKLLEHSTRDQRPFALSGIGPVMEDLRGICANVLSALPRLQRRGKGQLRQQMQRLRPAGSRS